MGARGAGEGWRGVGGQDEHNREIFYSVTVKFHLVSISTGCVKTELFWFNKRRVSSAHPCRRRIQLSTDEAKTLGCLFLFREHELMGWNQQSAFGCHLGSEIKLKRSYWLESKNHRLDIDRWLEIIYRRTGSCPDSYLKKNLYSVSNHRSWINRKRNRTTTWSRTIVSYGNDTTEREWRKKVHGHVAAEVKRDLHLG